MEALDLAALVGAVFLLLIVIRGAMLPRDYEVARMITLELDVVKVWPLMVDPRQMNSWRSDLRRVMRVPGERDLPAWIDVGVISRRNWRATELVAFKLVRATVENGLFPMRGEARIEITGNEARTIVVFREKGRIDSQFVRVLARWAIGLHSQPDAFLRALCRKFDQPAKITDVKPDAGGAPHVAPFDAAAEGYDAAFSDRLLGRLLRGLLHETLDRHLPRQGRLLELGCGTGVDATFMARRGANVVAGDLSAEMLAATRTRAEAAGVGDRVEAVRLDLARPLELRTSHGDAADGGLDRSFDGAWSAFGPLNCVADRRALGAALQRWLEPGARVVLVPMARFAPWDWLWYGAHLRPGAAVRRLRRYPRADLPGGGRLPLTYPTLRQLDAEMGPGLRRVEARGLGVLLPISEAAGLVERLPRLFEAAAAIERGLAGRGLSPHLCDHVAVVYERDR